MIFASKATASVVIASAIFGSSIFFPQFPTVNDIPTSYFSQKNTIYAVVERVIDGDTIRARHCPTRFSCPEDDGNSRRIYDRTLSIRVYGVDSPELQKRKSDPPSQPFAVEAKEFTSNLVLGKKVRIKLLRKDQYGRAVAKIEGSRRILPPFTRRDVSLELVRNGLATIYTGGGAEYDGNLHLLESLQKTAKERKKGVWSQGTDMVSPADFKRQKKLQMET